jgi:hypothetical protein
LDIRIPDPLIGSLKIGLEVALVFPGVDLKAKVCMYRTMEVKFVRLWQAVRGRSG